MLLRGAQIHRNGRGQYGLFPNPTFSSNRTQLPPSDVLSNTRMSLYDSDVSHHHFKPGSRHVPGSKDWTPFHMTRSGCRAVRLPRV